MHLMVTKYERNGKKYNHAKIVETYYRNGKPRKRVIKSLGPIRNNHDKIKAEKFLQLIKRGEQLISLSDLSVESSVDYGIIYVADELWKRYGIKNTLLEIAEKRRTQFDLERLTFLLAVDRLHNPSSDMDAYEWMTKDAFTGNVEIKPQYLYRTLDKLVEEKRTIEHGILKALKTNLKLNVDVVFYDLTSTYFEGEGPESADFNFRRTAKHGKKQIVIGLVLADGIPITHRIWPGNTTDTSTLKTAVGDLKKDFKIKNVVFVADRGVISAKNLNELEEKEYDYMISTTRRRDSIDKELMIKPVHVPEGKTIHAEKVCTIKAKTRKEKDRHYILCLDMNTRKERLEKLRDIRENVQKKLKELEGSTSKDLNAMVVEILGKNKRLFNYDTKNGLTYSLNKENWEYENNIAGKFMIVTTKNMNANDVMTKYKELRDIERAFRELKSSLKTRPAYHYTDKRVEGHVFVCVLGLLLRRLIERSTGMPTDKVLKELRRIRLVNTKIENEKILIRTELSTGHKEIITRLLIQQPSKFVME